MAEDVLDRINQIDDLFAETWDMRDNAKAKGDQESVGKLTKLLDDIHILRLIAIQLAYKEFAARMTLLSDGLATIAQKIKNWPFGGFTPHEKQFRDKDLPDNDFDDAGPDAPAVGPAPVPADKIPMVSAAWAENYQSLWDSMQLRDDWKSIAQNVAKKIVNGQAKYAAAVAGTTIPWWFIGVVHMMEGGLDFGTHLHNGDPLTARTVSHPAGHPAVIQGLPIDWVYSAKDSIVYERLDKVTDWSLPSVLYHWHRYNGISNEYKRRRIPTPYLWSGTQHYIKGLYTSDHHFEADKVSKQIGAAVLLRALIEIKAVSLIANQGATAKNKVATAQNLVSNPAAAAQHVASLELDLSGEPFRHLTEELQYPGPITVGAKKKMAVKRIQEWLYLQGFVTSIDSDFGASTAKQLGRFANANGRQAVDTLDEELWALLTAPLRKALAPIPVTPSLEAAIVKVARQHIAQEPTEVGGNNCGPWVRAYMRGEEGTAQKWCAGFVSFMIEQATRDLKVAIPFERRVGVDDLVADAKKTKRFISEDEVSTPLLRQSKLSPGYLFVVRASQTHWTHVGIVSSVMSGTFDTLEGNTGGDGGTDGSNAREGNRSFPTRDFIRIL